MFGNKKEENIYKTNRDIPISLKGEIVRETAKAVQFKYEDEDDIERVAWFPFSQIFEIHRTEPAEIKVSPWIYNEKCKEFAE